MALAPVLALRSSSVASTATFSSAALSSAAFCAAAFCSAIFNSAACCSAALKLRSFLCGRLLLRDLKFRCFLFRCLKLRSLLFFCPLQCFRLLLFLYHLHFQGRPHHQRGAMGVSRGFRFCGAQQSGSPAPAEGTTGGAGICGRGSPRGCTGIHNTRGSVDLRRSSSASCMDFAASLMGTPRAGVFSVATTGEGGATGAAGGGAGAIASALRWLKDWSFSCTSSASG